MNEGFFFFNLVPFRYRTEEDERWIKSNTLKSTEAAITNMTPGEKYIIQVNTLSYGTESNEPLQTSQTVRKYTKYMYKRFRFPSSANN